MLRGLILASVFLTFGFTTLIAQAPQKDGASSDQILRLTEAVERLTARIERLEAKLESLARDEKPAAIKPAAIKSVSPAALGILTAPDGTQIIIDDVGISGGKVLVRFRIDPATNGYFSLASHSQAIDDQGDSLKCTAAASHNNRIDFSLALLQMADWPVRKNVQVKGVLEFELASDKMQKLSSLTLSGRGGEYGTLMDLPISAR